MQVFQETGAYLKGHFRLTSGLHSDEYLQCALVLQHPKFAESFGRELAARLGPAGVVVSPAIGGQNIGPQITPALNAPFTFNEPHPPAQNTFTPTFFRPRPEHAV